MSYKKLQGEAKRLGLKYVGVPAEELEKAIAEAKESPQEEKQPSKGKESEKADAVVYNGRNKVRTYTFEQHGKDYEKLAEQFVSHPEREGYKVVMEEVTTRIACPYCGKKFRHP